jgi:tetratricopeptide (TPR) repeat protein
MAKPDEFTTEVGPSELESPAAADAPPVVPDHQMVRRIGRGSYGEVWLARNAVGTWRAVKVVYRANFREAHPYEREFSGIQKYEPISRSNEGLVDVLQIGRNDAAGYFYYVMELADDAAAERSEGVLECSIDGSKPTAEPCAPPSQGSAVLPLHQSNTPSPPPSESPLRSFAAGYVPKTLAQEIRARGRLPVEECITLGLTLDLALGHLHRHGLIHRDVKPSNIIFVNGVPKLADIGLVTDLAGAQSFVGTEGFIPPEGPNSPQADLYALGKVLYEASVGKDRQEFPEPFTALGLDTESKQLMELNSILLKACATNPKQRYASAEAMAADLALLNSGQSVQLKHALERRLSIMTRVGVGTLAVMLLGVVPYVWAIREARIANATANREADQRRRAQLSEKKAQTEAAKSQQVAGFLEEMLKAVGPSVAKGRDTTMLREILDQTQQRLAHDLAGQPEVQIEVRQIVGRTYKDLGLYNQQKEMALQNLELGRAALGERDRGFAVLLWDLGSAQFLSGDLDDAESTIRQALVLQCELAGTNSADVAVSLSELGTILWRKGKIEEAEQPTREALAINRKIHGNESKEVADSLMALAVVLNRQNKPGHVEMEEEALRIQRKVYGNDNPKLVTPLGNLAFSLSDQGRLEEAEARFREALDLARKSYTRHPTVAWLLRNLATVLRREHKLQAAEAMHREALAMRRELLKPDHPEIADSLNALATVLGEEGKLQEAEPLYREAFDLRCRLFGPDAEETVPSGVSLINVLVKRGVLSEAEDRARELNNVWEVKRPGRWETFKLRCLLGGILQREKKYPEAEPLLLSGYDGMRQTGPPPQVDGKANLKDAAEDLAQLYQGTGRLDQAAAWQQTMTELTNSSPAQPREMH